jgi:hypothetical protein
MQIRAFLPSFVLGLAGLVATSPSHPTEATAIERHVHSGFHNATYHHRGGNHTSYRVYHGPGSCNNTRTTVITTITSTTTVIVGTSTVTVTPIVTVTDSGNSTTATDAETVTASATETTVITMTSTVTLNPVVTVTETGDAPVTDIETATASNTESTAPTETVVPSDSAESATAVTTRHTATRSFEFITTPLAPW